MSAIALQKPAPVAPTVTALPIYRLSVAQYHDMARHGILKEDDSVELLEGILVQKMTKYTPHTFATQVLDELLTGMVPAGQWFATDQEPMGTADSEPEPDVFVARGRRIDYLTRGSHPMAAEVGLVAEVADSSLRTDQGPKLRIYARACIVQYWIVNLIDRRVEVYTAPSGPGDNPTYGQQRDYLPGDEVPVVLDGVEVGRIRVNDLMP